MRVRIAAEVVGERAEGVGGQSEVGKGNVGEKKVGRREEEQAG